MAVWQSILHALWMFLPAYVANMSPVLVAKLIPGWTAPIDGGRVAKDGQRVLGPGKTWRGLAGGTVLGGAAAVAVARLSREWGLMAGWDYSANGYCGGDLGPVACDAAGAAWWAVFLFGAFVGFMALVGDAVKSYFKRRTGRDRGRPWVPFDQLDFVVFGLAGMVVASPLLADGWLRHALLDDWVVLATLVVLTPFLHFLVNVLGYVLRLKEVPW